MPDLPSGTVTLLFTDIEGSTRLLDKLRERYGEVLAEHRRVLRQAFAAHNGVEVDTQGDAFFVAFARAQEAVAAAEQAQRALGDGPVRVRIGIHTGEPQLAGEGYVGMDVHRGARIAAAGHGGQVLLSQATRELLEETVRLRDLGEHRLKDLSAPLRLFQLGEREFPRLKTLHQTNLPIQPTLLIGRERELEEARALLREHRLLTLTGPGGTGKTRLALQLAADAVEDFADGVWWVPLQALREPELVLPTVAQAVGSKNGLADHLGGKQTLLLLDNFEQVAEAAPDLAELLAQTSEAKLLVTAREPLHLTGERRYLVEPLPSDDAVMLFNERAQAVDPAFEPGDAIAEICAHLDRLPLAIELAAARVNLLGVEALLERLEHRLPLLTGGARDLPERQRTLRATIEWSHELLVPEEQMLFARLSVFAGSFDLEAAEKVAGADLDTVQSLVEKSLVRRWGSGRLGMLETIHEFAAERREESGEAEELRRRHAEYFAELVERADPQLRKGGLQRRWVDRIDAEYDNLREAVQWSLASAPDLALRIGGNIGFFFWLRGHFGEARGWLDEALARSDAESLRLRAKAVEAASLLAERDGDVDATARHSAQCFALYSELGDDFGIASALRELAKATAAAGDKARTKELLEELVSHAERVGDHWNHAVALNNLGSLAYTEGDWERTIELCSQSRTSRIGQGDRWGAALTLSNIAAAEYRLGRRSESVRDYRQALRESVDVGSLTVAHVALEGWATAVAPERPREAARALGAAAVLREDHELRLLDDAYGEHDQTVAELQAVLGHECAIELDAGRAMSVEEAVAFVLAVEPAP
jgi:predicted ATPase